MHTPVLAGNTFSIASVTEVFACTPHFISVNNLLNVNTSKWNDTFAWCEARELLQLLCATFHVPNGQCKSHWHDTREEQMKREGEEDISMWYSGDRRSELCLQCHRCYRCQCVLHIATKCTSNQGNVLLSSPGRIFFSLSFLALVDLAALFTLTHAQIHMYLFITQGNFSCLLAFPFSLSSPSTFSWLFLHSCNLWHRT